MSERSVNLRQRCGRLEYFAIRHPQIAAVDVADRGQGLYDVRNVAP
jgi:hypothetical protein